MDAGVWEYEKEQKDDAEARKDRERKERHDHMAFKALQDIRAELEKDIRYNNNNRNAEV